MAYSKAQARKAKQAVLTGDKQMTGTLDAATTTEIVAFSGVAAKVTWQSTGSLAGNIEFTSNGTDFYTSTAFTATVAASYSTNNVIAVKVTRTGGSGKLVLSVT